MNTQIHMYFIHNYLALVPMLLWKLSYYTTTKLGGWLGQEIRAGSRPKTHTKVKDSVLNFSLVITFHIKMILQQCLGQKCSINTCESWCATNAWQALVKTVVILQLSCLAHAHCVACKHFGFKTLYKDGTQITHMFVPYRSHFWRCYNSVFIDLLLNELKLS